MQQAIIKRIGWLAVALALAFFVISEIGIQRTQTLETDFLSGNRSFSALGPPTRIDGRDATTGNTKIVGEPVYFDVRLPVLTERASVTIVWDKTPTLPDPQIGVVLGGFDEPDQRFALYPPEAVRSDVGTLDVGTLDVRRWTSNVQVDLRGVPRRDGGVRFLISIPGASSTTPFFLGPVQIAASRPPFGEVLRRFK
ncbi:hypothetical protein EPN90_03155 [Patescibacteria group bacterium]|nr:MAG: hypothetical protein EPN90_03155 [Patescibacteria group bacterium]